MSTMNIVELAERVFEAARGNQVKRKDKDTMRDTGGSSKGRQRDPKQRPRRDDARVRYRTRNLTPEERDPDNDNDPDTKEGAMDTVVRMVNRVAALRIAEEEEDEALVHVDQAVTAIIASLMAIEENLPNVKADTVAERAAIDGAQDLLDTALKPYTADLAKMLDVFGE